MSTSALYLHWEGKKLYRQRVPTPRLLEPVVSESVGDTISPNMVIEGDNLQVLASLKSQYAGSVDVIYIDPPYNLGTDDFRYSDRRFRDPDADADDGAYVTNEDGGRHTKWLNFMAPRLYMLWQMLSEDRGLIFVSINDVELFRLGMLMNEVFGEDNHVGTLVWNGSTDNNPTRIATEHEYILCYAKNKSRLPSVWKGRQSDAKDRMLEEYERIAAETGDLTEIERRFRRWVRQNASSLTPLTHYIRIDEKGPYTGSRKVHNPGKDGYFYDVPHPNGGVCTPPARGYRFPKETMQSLIDSGSLIYGDTHDQIVQIKVYLKDYVGSLKSVINLDSRTGANTLADLFGDRNLFRNPKPVELIELLLDYTTHSDSLVLDAFAGSGTTGHAVMSLNQKDGGKRRFILIEEGKPGDRFCRSLTADRLRRAIDRSCYADGFTFFQTGRKLDRAAIVGLERDALVSLICLSDETGRGRGIVPLAGHRYIVGKNHRNEAVCLVWNGKDDSEVTREHLCAAAEEVFTAGLKTPFRIYGTSCRYDDPTWKFCKIPDEILAQMHLEEELGDDA